MSRRARWLSLLLVLVAVAAPAACGGPPARAQARPNIVLVLVDDLDGALFADAIDDLPNLRALREQGMTFTRYFASTPLCCPSRASMLRGQYAQNHGVLWNRGEAGGQGGFEAFHRLGREESTVATWLQDAGYRTALLGKYLNGYPQGAPENYVTPGWDFWAGHPAEKREAFYFDYTLNENGTIVSYGHKPEDYSTDVLSGLATRFIDETPAGLPFFLFVAPYAPHDPAVPAPRHADAFAGDVAPRAPSFNEADVSDKPSWVRALPRLNDEEIALIDSGYRDRKRSMLAVDDLVGAIVAQLEARGELDSTYLVFASDNGFHFGEHRVPFGKVTPYDESVRLPLVVRGPGVAPGSTEGRLVLNHDFAVTFADLAGVAPPDFVDGRSFAPLLHGDPPATWRASILLRQFEDIGERQAVQRRQAEQRRAATRATRAAAAGTPAAGVPRATRPPGTPRPAGAQQPGRRSAGAEENPGRLSNRFTQAVLPPFAALRGETTLYVEYGTGEREFYDLAADPAALDNRAAALDPTTLEALHQRLAELEACATASCRAAEDAPLPLP